MYRGEVGKRGAARVDRPGKEGTGAKLRGEAEREGHTGEARDSGGGRDAGRQGKQRGEAERERATRLSPTSTWY